MTGKTIDTYTEEEFISFVERICNADFESEEEHDQAVMEFRKLSEHPDGSNLIYYPEQPGDDTPERITQIVKEWRASNGKPGFKAA